MITVREFRYTDLQLLQKFISEWKKRKLNYDIQYLNIEKMLKITLNRYKLGIGNILYNDMNVLLLIVGFTLFISLINIKLILHNFYSLVLKKRNTLSNVDIYNLLDNASMYTLIS